MGLEDAPSLLWPPAASAVPNGSCNVLGWIWNLLGFGGRCAVHAWAVSVVGLFVMSESAPIRDGFAVLLKYKDCGSGPGFVHVPDKGASLTS